VYKERKGLFSELKKSMVELEKKNINVIIHCASLGEFEEAKPIIKKLKEDNKDIGIIITFFSPSGYKNYSPLKEIDVVCYLPFDSYFNVKKFFSIVKPSIFLIVKHDIWPNYIWYAKNYGIPVILVDAYMKASRIKNFFLIRSFFKNLYNEFKFILVASDEDKKRFELYGVESDKIIVSGDTRYDEVYFISMNNRLNRNENINVDGIVFIAGSTWPQDEDLIIPVIGKVIEEYKDFYTIIVPHEPTKKNLNILFSKLENYGIKYKTFLDDIFSFNDDVKVIVVNRVGILSKLYKLSDIAYVGGGFSTGVHNVMEPVVYGLPVFFGRKYDNSPEARELVLKKGGFSVGSKEELYEGIVSFIKDKEKRVKTGEVAKNIILNNLGATGKILKYIKDCLNKGKS